MRFLGDRTRHRYVGYEFNRDSFPRPFIDGSIEEETKAWVAVGIRARYSEPLLQFEVSTPLSRPIYELLDWLLPDRNMQPRKGWCTTR